jgi:hypothetical protein
VVKASAVKNTRAITTPQVIALFAFIIVIIESY